MGRIPSTQEVAGLSRDDWEDVCRNLAAIIHQAQGVEDRMGKGNGLDMIRLDPDGASGWQFRRFDDRFGSKQASDVLDSIRLAAKRCTTEDKTSLVRFALWANIDLEPGHRGSKGERERFKEIADVARDEHGVTVEFVGVTWVRAQLLRHSELRPSLFENVSQQVEAVREQLMDQGDVLQQIAKLAEAVANATLGSPDAARAKRLVEQALVHYQRGLSKGSAEQFRSALTCFEDAAHLLHGMELDAILEGRVLIAVAGVRKMLGELLAAETAAREALNLLPSHAAEFVAQAKGTLALVLQDMQRFREAEPLMQAAFSHFESQADMLEMVRSLTHLVELGLNAHEFIKADYWGERLIKLTISLESIMGISDVSIAAAGATARRLFEQGRRLESISLLREAEARFAALETFAIEHGLTHLTIAARGQRAETVRYQNRLAEAASLYASVFAEAERADMNKAAADAMYSQALVLEEMLKVTEAMQLLRSAQQRYDAIGDVASSADAERQIKRLS